MKMTISLPLPWRFIFFIASVVPFIGCHENSAEPPSTQRTVQIRNTNTISFGLKSRFYSYIPISGWKDSIRVAAGSSVAVATIDADSHAITWPDTIDVYDSTFSRKYTSLGVSSADWSGSDYTWVIPMPSAKSGAVVLRNYGVEFFKTSAGWVGLTPTNANYSLQSFFTASNAFESIVLSSLPTESSTWMIDRVVGQTIYAHDGGAYSNTSLMMSTDLGMHWDIFVNQPTSQYGFSSDNVANFFLDDTHQWYFIYENYTRTRVFSVLRKALNEIPPIEGYCAHQCVFVDSSVGYLLANSPDNVSPSTAPNTYCLSTIDGGLHWSTPVQISSTLEPARLWAFGRRTLIATLWDVDLGYRSYYKSIDGGASWMEVKINTGNTNVDISFVNADTAYVKTGGTLLWSMYNMGDVYKTTDGGATWKMVSVGKQYGSSIKFSDDKNGIMRDLRYGEGQILLRTSDGGVKWDQLLYPYSYVKE